jgi:hypothetical protein
VKNKTEQLTHIEAKTKAVVVVSRSKVPPRSTEARAEFII